MLELVVFALMGIGVGVVTGVIPGFHPNLLATLFLGYAFFPPLQSSVMLVAAGVTNSFLNFIPTIYLGAPSASTALSVLPGHKMLLEGRGYEALRLTVMGGLIAMGLIVISLPLSFFSISKIYPLLESNIHLILVGIISYMFFRDRDLNGVLLFFLSGALGYVVMELNFIGTRYDLFPLLSGLFGISMLLNSRRKDPDIPAQDRSLKYVDKERTLKGGLIGGLSGMLVGILPGIGSAQATYLSHEFAGEKSLEKFMVAIGGVNTSNILFSLLAIYFIGSGRSGVAVTVQQLLSSVTVETVILFVLVALVASGIGAFLTLFLGKRSLRIFRKIDYGKLCLGVIVFVFGMISLLTGWRGVIVAAVGASIGLGCILSGCRRSYLMGCILIPVIIYFI